MGYQFKTKPRAHQGTSLVKSLREPVWAHFHEQRCGKTKIVIDTAAYHYEAPDPNPLRVNALMVIAMPSGVPSQWVLDEIPAHLPDRIPRKCVVWRANRVKTKAFQRDLEELLTFKGLSVLAVNGEAIITKAFRQYAPKFLRARHVLVAADETTLICKTAGTERSKMMRAIGKFPNVVIKRIMDGTPYGESPMDFYAQFEWMDKRILGHDSYHTYKLHYAVLEKQMATRNNVKTGLPERYEYDAIVGYRNLDELNKRIFRVADRVRRADISDAPPKTYIKLRFDLTAEQRRVYDQIEEEHEAILRTGHIVTVAHVLTRQMRLQQVTSNILPTAASLVDCKRCGGIGSVEDSLCETCDGLGVVPVPGPVVRIDAKNNPRVEMLHDHVMLSKSPSIVWCRFQSDVDDIMSMLKKAGRRPVQYDGRVSGQDKDAAKAGFQRGDYTDVVGNPKAGGRGLRLDRAESVYYYSNIYSLIVREQSEDRAEDVDRKISTVIADLMANDTEDEAIADNLRAKRTVSELVMREKRGKWL